MSVSENLKDETKISASRRRSSSDPQLTAEELAPDGGWGWIIFAGTTLSYIVCFGSGSSFGMIYGEILTETGNDGLTLTILNVMYLISFTFSGLLSNELLKRYSIKSVGLLGAMTYSTSVILVAFMPSISYMAITQFLQGIGTGIIACIINTSLNSYFVKRKSMVFAISQMIVSTATIFFPYLAEHLLTTYGFRGCMIVFGAISLNTVCGMMTIQPVEMHYRKPKLISRKIFANCDGEINEDNLSGHVRNMNAKIRRLTDLDSCKNNRSVQSLEAWTETEKPLLIKALTGVDLFEKRVVPSLDLEMGSHSRIPCRDSNQELFSNRISLMAATSMASMGRIGGFIDIGHPIVELEAKHKANVNRRITSVLADFFEISLLRDRVYINMCLGMSLISVTDATFQNFLPPILANDGYTTIEIALVLTVAAVAEVVSRICLATFMIFYKAKARYIFCGSVCALLLSKIAFLHCRTLSSVIISIAAINFARSWCHVTLNLVIAEHFAVDRFVAAFGLYLVISGISGLTLCPVIGVIKDWTNSYVVMQYLLLGGITLCIASWTVQIWICDILPRYKKTVNAETECSKK